MKENAMGNERNSYGNLEEKLWEMKEIAMEN